MAFHRSPRSTQASIGSGVVSTMQIVGTSVGVAIVVVLPFLDDS